MCVTEIYRDRYPDGSEVQFRQLKSCQYGRPGQPCQTHYTMENAVRQIKFGEPTTEFLLTQVHTPRTSSSSHRPESIVEIIDESPRSDRRKKKKRSSLLMSTFFGQSPSNSPHRRGRQRIVIETSPPESIRTPRTPPLVFTEQRAPMTPPPFIRDVSPTRRGRHRVDPIIVDVRRPRPTSTAAQIGSRNTSRHRSPSPKTYWAQQRARQNEEDAARRRRRDEDEARLEAEIRAVRRARQREREYAEIMARPVVPMPPRIRYRPVIEQSDRLHEALRGLTLSTRLDAEEAEASRERLRRRLTVGGGTTRRHRVLYDDGVYRYED